MDRRAINLQAWFDGMRIATLTTADADSHPVGRCDGNSVTRQQSVERRL
jgi:hypothetical protein